MNHIVKSYDRDLEEVLGEVTAMGRLVREQLVKAADGMPLKLSVKEFRLLLMFASRPGRVFTRGQLLENIWGNSFVDERTVDVHMLRLRKALAGTAAENLIETVRGVGYRCRPLD